LDLISQPDPIILLLRGENRCFLLNLQGVQERDGRPARRRKEEEICSQQSNRQEKKEAQKLAEKTDNNNQVKLRVPCQVVKVSEDHPELAHFLTTLCSWSGREMGGWVLAGSVALSVTRNLRRSVR
jgi:hypothetical protein